MKYNREYILSRAFEVFMNKGYDSTSISVLQTELNMSRGAMYRYFKNKEELFISVIDKYVLEFINRLIFKQMNNLTVSILIEQLHKQQSLYTNILINSGVTHASFLNYTALIIQAAKHYPGFVQKFHQIRRRLIIIWKLALRKSIMQGEIKPDTDIDICSHLFANILFQEITNDNRIDKTDEIRFKRMVRNDIKARKQILDYLYKMIKC